MSGEKTISIDPSLFSDKGNGRAKTPKNKTIRKEKKVRPKIKGQNATTLRRNLLAKIKEHQKKENQESLASEKNAATTNKEQKPDRNVKIINAHESFDDEFSKSLAYLNELAKSRENKKLERKNRIKQKFQQTKPVNKIGQTKPVNKIGQTNPVNRIGQNDLIKPRIPIPLPNSAQSQIPKAIPKPIHRTLKHSTNTNTPEISLEMPTELMNEPKPLEVQVLPTSIAKISSRPNSSILGFKPKPFIQQQPKPNIQLTPKPQTQPKTQHEQLSFIPKINNDPPFGVLKGGSKPTFRQFNKTQKNTNNSQTNNPSTSSKPNPFSNINNVKPPPIKIEGLTNTKPKVQVQSAREHILNELKEKRNAPTSKPLVIPEKKSRSRTKTVKRTTSIRKFKLGKNAKKRVISVLVKNNTTRRNIKQEVGELKRTPIKEIKVYLRKHGLLKVGSSAPNDVLRHIYQQSVLSGDIHNMSKDTLIHNFFNDKEEF